jgi:hypothetical protein
MWIPIVVRFLETEEMVAARSQREARMQFQFGKRESSED